MKLLQTVLIGIMVAMTLFSCSRTLSEKEYYSAARDAYTKENFELAIQNFKSIVEHYPEGERGAEAAFMLGFINANDLKKYDEAKIYYTTFIEKYPEHDLADDAQYELETLGKDINELPIFKQLNSDSLQK